MKLFFKYLKQRRRGILGAILFLIIFAVTFSLYRLPVKAVLYPASLCLLLGAVFIVLDFIRAKRKHAFLRKAKSFSDIVSGPPCKADSIEDEDYQSIIELLKNEHLNSLIAGNKKYAEMIDYYSVWVHQIKTPIASMKLTLQNEDTPLSRKLSNDLFRIEQYAQMVMTFLRLNSETNDFVIKEYSIDDMIRQAVKKFSGEFIGRRLSLKYAPINKKVITDEKWFSFVIEQVLSNALKYTPAGSISIYLEGGDRLCIKDTGIGIAPEDLPRIFEKGYTGYNGRADKKASGIGLYLCKRICTKLGHGIEAQSQVDVGTTVTISLSRQSLEIE